MAHRRNQSSALRQQFIICRCRNPPDITNEKLCLWATRWIKEGEKKTHRKLLVLSNQSTTTICDAFFVRVIGALAPNSKKLTLLVQLVRRNPIVFFLVTTTTTRRIFFPRRAFFFWRDSISLFFLRQIAKRKKKHWRAPQRLFIVVLFFSVLTTPHPKQANVIRYDRNIIFF